MVYKPPVTSVELLGRLPISKSAAMTTAAKVESQIKVWIRAGLIKSADVLVIEDGIETRLTYPAGSA